MSFDLQLLYASDLEGGSVVSLNSAVNFAAIIDKLDDSPIPTLVLSAGDNFIPGPFYAAGGDLAGFRTNGVLNTAYNSLFAIPTTETNKFNALRELSGIVDISIMNVIGFDASALGNHEFDSGTGPLAELIKSTSATPEGPQNDRYVGTLFPYLSANLNFDADTNLRPLFTDSIIVASSGSAIEKNISASARKIAPAALFNLSDSGGASHKVVVIGATTPILRTISSPGGVIPDGGGGLNTYPANEAERNVVVRALAAELQPTIDLALSQGVNKVVLVTHLQQVQMEKDLIKVLRGVDVMIAGGSGSSSFDNGSTLATSDDIFTTTNAEGNPAYVVSVPGEYSTVGQLQLRFDDLGVPSIVKAVGIPATTAGVNSIGANTSTGSALIVQGLVNAVQSVVLTKDQDIKGYTNVYLQGNRDFIRTQETNFGNLSADSQLWKARQVDPTIQVSLKNGGGLRAPIGDVAGTDSNPLFVAPLAKTIPLDGYEKPAGAISQLDIENTLRFNNSLVRVDTTAAGLRTLMEHSISASYSGNTPGQFPQVAGMRFSFNHALDFSSKDLGQQRLESLVIVNDAGDITDVIVKNGNLVGDGLRPIKMVTLSFLATTNGDSYPFSTILPITGVATKITDLKETVNAALVNITEQSALSQYLQTFHPTPAKSFNKPENPDFGLGALVDNRIINIGLGNLNSAQLASQIENSTSSLFPIGSIDLDGAEIASYSPEHKTAIVITGGNQLTLVDVKDFRKPVKIASYTLDGDAQSVDVKGDLVAVAVAAPNLTSTSTEYATSLGEVSFFRLSSLGQVPSLTKLGDVPVGALPDSLKFNADGKRLVVANEAESINVVNPSANDAPGSISVIDTSSFGAGTINVGTFTTQTIVFTSYNGQAEKLNLQGIRINQLSGSVAQDIEPEGIAILGNRAWVTLQENNAVVEIDLSTGTLKDIWTLGIKDWFRGSPEAKNLSFTLTYPGSRPDFNSNNNIDVGEVTSGGISGAWYGGIENGSDIYYAITDRGPQAQDIGTRVTDNLNDPNKGQKIFDDPSFPITVYKLAKDSAGLRELSSVTLKVPDGNGSFRPSTGIGALPSHDKAFSKVGIDSNGKTSYAEVPRDAFGLDSESVNLITVPGLNSDRPMFAVADEYFPQIALFDQISGNLVQRFVPSGTDFSSQVYNPGRGDVSTFTKQTLPAIYGSRWVNRGFEGMAYNSRDNLLYAFIQSPIRPIGFQNTEFIRIIAINPLTGIPQAEYLHQLTAFDTLVDKIGDAVFDSRTGRFLIIERDSSATVSANKSVIEIDLSGATNVLPLTLGTGNTNWNSLIGVAQPELLTKSTATNGYSIADALLAKGIRMANRVELFNIPSVGGDPRFDKPEGLALKPDGTMMVFNDNDFVSVVNRPDNLAVEIRFSKTPLDVSDKTETGGLIGIKDIYGMPMADGIDAFESNGSTYLIVAGEGDDRDSDLLTTSQEILIDKQRVSSTTYTNKTTLQTQIGDRLNLITNQGNYDTDTDLEQPYVLGSRSFRIYDDQGNLVFDSGNQLDEIAKSNSLYDDGRSDDKGVEPEMVITRQIKDRIYAFVGFERSLSSAIAIFDVTEPRTTSFVKLLSSPSSTSPEGLSFITTRSDGSGVLMASNEVTGTLDFFSIFENPTIGSTTALIPEASAANEASELLDGFSGDTAFPYGRFKALATVGEIDATTGRALTGYPDGNAAWLKDNDTITVAYQSESYATMSKETYAQVMESGARFTGSKVHTIDYERAGFADFLKSNDSGADIVESSGFLFDTVYNVFGDEVKAKSAGGVWGNQALPTGALVEFAPAKQLKEADFFFQSFCGAWYEQKNKYGTDIGFADDVWLMGEEWNIASMFAGTGVDTHNTMGLASMAVDVKNGVAYTVPALGQSGYEKLMPMNSGSDDLVVIVASGYNHDVSPAPNKIYIGRKDVDADGRAINYNTANERDKFLGRNGLLYGQLYGLALDDTSFASLGLNANPASALLDTYLKDGNAPDQFSGRFYPTSYQWQGWGIAEAVSVKNTEMNLWKSALEQPNDYTFFNGETKVEHGAVDPDITKFRYVQNMTASGAILGFDFSKMLTEIEANDADRNGLPDYLSVDVNRIVAAVGGEIRLSTNGKGIAANSANAGIHIEANVAKLVSPDGLHWIKGADGDLLILDEDSGNDYGERKMALPLDSESFQLAEEGKGYFLAQAGGSKNPRDIARASALGGAFSSPTSAEFSGSWNVTALVSKKSDGSFYSASELAGTGEQLIIQGINLKDQTLIGVVQAPGQSGGLVAANKADYGGQIFQFNLATLPVTGVTTESLIAAKPSLAAASFNPGTRVNLDASGFSLGSNKAVIDGRADLSVLRRLPGGMELNLSSSDGVRVLHPQGALTVDLGVKGLLELSKAPDMLYNLGGGANVIRGGEGPDVFEMDSDDVVSNFKPDVIRDFQAGLDQLVVNTSSGQVVFGANTEVSELRNNPLLAGVSLQLTPDLRTASGRLLAISGQTSLLGAGLRLAQTDASIQSVELIVSGGSKLQLDLMQVPAGIVATANSSGTQIVFKPGLGIDSLEPDKVRLALGAVRFEGSTGGSVEVRATDAAGLVATSTERPFSLISATPVSTLRPSVVRLDGAGGDLALMGVQAKALQVHGGEGVDAVRLSRAIEGRHSGYGFGGADVLSAPEGGRLAGGSGDDILIGSANQLASLSGGSGNDTLVAGVGDVLLGGSGNDLLLALGGGNVLQGGAGVDRFVLTDGYWSGVGGVNVVSDFQVGIDKLVFAGQLTNATPVFSNISSGTKVELGTSHVATILGVSSSAITVAQDVIMQSASQVAVLGNRYADVAQLRQEISAPF